MSHKGTVAGTVMAVALLGCGYPFTGGSNQPSDPWESPSTSADLKPVWEGAAGTITPGGSPSAAAVDDWLVLEDLGTLEVLDRWSGRQVWSRDDAAGAKVAGDVVVLADEGAIGGDTPDVGEVTVLDLATGEELWHRETSDETGNIAVFSDAIYTRDCPGTSRTGCTLSRRDLRTGKARWTTPTSASGRVVGTAVGPFTTDILLAPPSGRLLGYKPLWGNGGDRRRRPLDAATGKLLKAAVPMPEQTSTEEEYALTETTFVHGDSAGAVEAGESYEYRLTGYDAGAGDERWRRKVLLPPQEYSDPEGSYQLLGTDRSTLVANDARHRPIALDLDSGKLLWTGTSAALPLAADRTTVIARQGTRSGPLTAWDAETGRPRWKRPTPEGLSAVAVLGKNLVLDLAGYGTYVLSTKTGRTLFHVPEHELIAAGNDWLLLREDAGDKEFRYYRLD